MPSRLDTAADQTTFALCRHYDFVASHEPCRTPLPKTPEALKTLAAQGRFVQKLNNLQI